MQRHPDYTRARIRQIAERMEALIYSDRRPIEDVRVAGPTERISFPEAQKLSYRPAKVGERFGPHWATFWFRLKCPVPAAWKGKRVDLLWDSNSEATLWLDGKSAQGLNTQHGGIRPDAILLRTARGGETLQPQIEMACNQKFGVATASGQLAGVVETYQLARCEIAAFDLAAWKLFYDFSFLVDLETDLARDNSDPTFAGHLLFELNRFANEFDPTERGTWGRAGAILTQVFRRRPAAVTHEISAIGHAHIDTAWLWPLAETWRKCQRTFASQTAYMADYPEYRFACSQAVQYEQMKQRDPDLYRRIVAAHKRGQWVPVGGTWVEPDCNIPSGEALIRQFLYGQRFFEKEFGRRCNEFWNPDVFGYNGQLPQILRGCGVARFLTQKLSWNRFTKPPHHTFLWQGIDGSEVLAHFPPADTYNADASVREIRHSVANYKDHDRSRESAYLFGFGDGGGGPTKRMLEYLRRAKDVQGMPRVTMRSSDEFFERLEQDLSDPPRIVGELYFELHRGTYTSQAQVKRGNRKSERLMHDIELLASLAWMNGAGYPHKQIDGLWKTVLLNQFHDILPGSSIDLVYQDAHRDYERILSEGTRLREELLTTTANRLFNTIGFAREQVIEIDGELELVRAAPFSAGEIVDATDEVSITPKKGGWVLENAAVRATISRGGRLTSLVEKSSGREALAAEGNVFQIFDDTPTVWEAWDVDPYHLETAADCPAAKSAKIVTDSPLRAEIRFEHSIGKSSRLTQTVRLDAHGRRVEVHCEVDWRESRKFLKVAFPVNARAMHATYEMQFGVVERPTHFNTPGDLGKFEVPLHKWFDLSEHGFGVAILSESKYGGSVLGNVMRLSLLRAPNYPDPQADRGKHSFSYAIMPHAGSWQDSQVVAEGYRFNSPLIAAAEGGVGASPAFSRKRKNAGETPAPCSFAIDCPNLVIDTVKKAEDSDALILRIYECHGSRGLARLTLPSRFSRAKLCNFLEDEGQALAVDKDGNVEIAYRPFQVVCLKVR